MRINQNIAAFNAYRNLSVTSGQQSKSLEKLSSGFRINRAADDASGLVNSENLRAQIGGLKVATRNAQDAISLVQTAEGAQTEVHSILQRMRDLVVQTGNTGTNDDASVEANQSEIDQLKSELNRIAGQTQFGTKQILGGELAEGDGTATHQVADGEWHTVGGEWTQNNSGGAVTVGNGEQYQTADSSAFTFQVGANSGQTVETTVNASFAFNLGSDAAQGDTNWQVVEDINLSDDTVSLEKNVADALNILDDAISGVSDNRATLGAFQNRMESTIRNVSVATENLQAAESRIRDVDMASEMVNFTRHQIMQQAGTAMLAQANQVPQSVLSLLR